MDFFRARLETVADPRFGVNVARVPRIGLDFFSQLIDEHAQILCFFPVVRTPDCLQQAPMAESFPLIRDEVAEQFEFLGCEADGISMERHGAFGEVNFQIVGDERGRRFLRRAAAEGRANAREEFLGAEGLYNVIVSAGVEGLDFVTLGVAHSEHDDGNIAGLADFAADVEAGDSGQIDVEENQAGMIAAQFLESLFAGFGFEDGVALRSKGGAHDAADLGLVVNDQNGGGVHAFSGRA